MQLQYITIARLDTHSPSMHVARISRTYKGKTYVTHLLRRSYRDGHNVKHKTLANLSHLPLHLIELIRRSLQGEHFASATDLFRITHSQPQGHVEAILTAVTKLGLDTMIASKPSRQRNLIVALIAERLLFPCSKLATTRHWHSTTLAEELGITDATPKEVYQALDWLSGRQKKIEDRLAARHLMEGAHVLYDVSSSFYEGHTCPLAQYGYDRDGKKKLPIIVYGLLTDNEGRPIAVDVYPGNTADPSTVPDQTEKLRQRFGLERIVLVGDRGMLTQTQIEALQAYPGLGWISALRSNAIRDLIADKALERSLFDTVNLAEIISPDFPGERLIACYNPVLKEQRWRKRQELLAKTEEKLTALAQEVSRRTQTPLTATEIALKAGRIVHRWKMAKHIQLTIGENVFTWSRRQESIREEEQLDGIYGVRSAHTENCREKNATNNQFCWLVQLSDGSRL